MNDDYINKVVWVTIGAVAIVFNVAVLLSGGLMAVLKVIGKTFDSFGVMMTSLGGFLIVTGKLIVLGTFTIGFAISGAWLLYKFVVLVKDSTALMERFDEKSGELMDQLRAEHGSLEKNLTARVRYMERTLEEALAEPEIAPAPTAGSKSIPAKVETPKLIEASVALPVATQDSGQDSKNSVDASVLNTAVSSNL